MRWYNIGHVFNTHYHQPSTNNQSSGREVRPSVDVDIDVDCVARRRQLCVILEPMQELMTRHKAYSLSPRDCLKTTLFQKWQRMVAPPGQSGGGAAGGGGCGVMFSEGACF